MIKLKEVYEQQGAPGGAPFLLGCLIFGFVFSMKEYASKFYSSIAWKACRDSYKKKAGGLCERCKAKGIVKPGEVVHHKQHITPANINDDSITLSFDNLQLLCRDCHAEVHKRQGARRYYVDKHGRIIAKD